MVKKYSIEDLLKKSAREVLMEKRVGYKVLRDRYDELRRLLEFYKYKDDYIRRSVKE